jgi:hypothetical protein
MGLRFRSRGYEQPSYQETRGTTNSKRLTTACSDSSDNDLRPWRPNSSSDDLRVDAAATRPSPTSPLEGQGQAIKAKELEARSADGSGDLVGDEDFSGHLSTSRSPLKSSRTGQHRPPRGGVVPEHG